MKQVGTAIKDSTKVVRDVLHVIDGNMKRALKKNQPVLANWTATRRIQATVVTPLPDGISLSHRLRRNQWRLRQSLWPRLRPPNRRRRHHHRSTPTLILEETRSMICTMD